VKITDLSCSLLERGLAGGGGPTIHIPEGGNPGRRRFSTAHEIGHYILGHRINCPKNDREANYFSACLLMPKKMFVHEWDDALDWRNRRVERVAEIFQVSLTSARIRAKELGLT